MNDKEKFIADLYPAAKKISQKVAITKRIFGQPVHLFISAMTILLLHAACSAQAPDSYMSKTPENSRPSKAVLSNNSDAKNDTNQSFDGEWAYAKKCDLGHFINIAFRQAGNKISGTWSYGTNLSGSDGLLEGTIRDGRLFVRHCSQDEASGYKACPTYGDEAGYFVRQGEDLIRYQKYGNDYKKDVVLHRDTPGLQLLIDNTDCQEEADKENTP